jgi:hypothetical protein
LKQVWDASAPEAVGTTVLHHRSKNQKHHQGRIPHQRRPAVAGYVELDGEVELEEEEDLEEVVLEPEPELEALVQQPAAVVYFVVNFVPFWDGTFGARIPVYICVELSGQSLSIYYSMKLIERTILAKFQQHQSIEELKHVIDRLIRCSSFKNRCCEANSRFPLVGGQIRYRRFIGGGDYHNIPAI